MPRLPRSRPAQRSRLLQAYVAPEVVAHIMSDGRAPLLSGVRVPVTVLFADVRGFTRLADVLAAERVVAILDRHFAAMTAAAVEYGAMIDKLIGDAIMVVYGLPAIRGDEARRALLTAAAMHGAFDEMLPRWREIPRSVRLGLAVGIAAGDAVLANVGSAVRMDYTLIGATVNRAARLTAAAGRGETLVDGAVQTAAGTDRAFLFRAPRLLRLKGFRHPVRAYACRTQTPTASASPPTVVTDPVCGMKLDARAAVSLVRNGRRYYFCSQRCRAAFRRAPQERH
jgi:class 3 adenylate cyclase/YHS domain-containing protein